MRSIILSLIFLILTLPLGFALWEEPTSSNLMTAGQEFESNGFTAVVLSVDEDNADVQVLGPSGKIVGRGIITMEQDLTIEEEVRIKAEEFVYRYEKYHVLFSLESWIDGEILDVHAPEQFELDRKYDVEIDIRNTGPADASYVMMLEYDDTELWSDATSRRISLGQNERGTISFEIRPIKDITKPIDFVLISADEELGRKSISGFSFVESLIAIKEVVFSEIMQTNGEYPVTIVVENNDEVTKSMSIKLIGEYFILNTLAGPGDLLNVNVPAHSTGEVTFYVKPLNKGMQNLNVKLYDDKLFAEESLVVVDVRDTNVGYIGTITIPENMVKGEENEITIVVHNAGAEESELVVKIIAASLDYDVSEKMMILEGQSSKETSFTVKPLLTGEIPFQIVLYRNDEKIDTESAVINVNKGTTTSPSIPTEDDEESELDIVVCPEPEPCSTGFKKAFITSLVVNFLLLIIIGINHLRKMGITL